MAKGRNHWSDKKQMKESAEAYEARLERRRRLAELRATASTVERDGKTFYYVQVPEEYKTVASAL